MFNPAATILGILPGGWLSIVLALAGALVFSRLLVRYTVLSAAGANLVLAVFASLVLYTGFTWDASAWLQAAYWVAVAVASLLVTVDHFMGTADGGWTKGEVVTGDKIDWEKNRRDAGPQAFAKETIDTVEKYAEHRKGTSAADIAGTKIVTDNTPAELHATFLRGEGVIPVQFTQASCVNGSTGFDGQKVIRFAELCYEPGDIWWVPVGPDGTVYWAAAVRADCGNPGLYLVPYPRDRLAPSVCPLGSDRPGKSILGGCYGKPEQPKPPADTPTAQPSPEKVKVCINSDGATAYVPKSEVHMYQRPNADGTCVKNPGTEAANKGNAGNGGGRSQDPGPDATTTPSQPPGTPRVNPTVPAPDPSAPPPTNPATGCVPYRGRPCP